MSIDVAQVRKIAHLARIDVPQEEEASLAQDLSRILGIAEQLAEVDTAGVEPMSSVARMKLPFRHDVVSDGGYAEDLLANGPDVTGAYFVVPKVIE